MLFALVDYDYKFLCGLFPVVFSLGKWTFEFAETKVFAKIA